MNNSLNTHIHTHTHSHSHKNAFREPIETLNGGVFLQLCTLQYPPRIHQEENHSQTHNTEQKKKINLNPGKPLRRKRRANNTGSFFALIGGRWTRNSEQVVCRRKKKQTKKGRINLIRHCRTDVKTKKKTM